MKTIVTTKKGFPWPEAWWLAGAAALPVLALFASAGLSRADLSAPFFYASDALWTLTMTKGLMENGWCLRIPSLGMPTGYFAHDFPLGDSLHMAFLKILSLFTAHAPTAVNMFFLMSFPLTGLFSFIALQRFGISRLPSLFGSLLFAFLPYHFRRGEEQLFLSSYYVVPLAVMVLFWIYREDRFLLNGCEGQSDVKRNFMRILSDPRSLASLAICLAVSLSGVYYAFFSCFLLAVTGALAALDHKKMDRLFTSFLLIVFIAGGSLLNYIPTFLHALQNGRNVLVAIRLPVESEFYGFKMAQLLFPPAGHRLMPLARLGDAYAHSAPFVNENAAAALGIVGAAGFALLAFILLFAREKRGPWRFLAVLNAAAFSLGTVGGLGTVIAYTVFTQFRGYNRISVFISFFSLWAVCLALDGLRRRFVHGRKAKAAFILGVVLLGAVGIWDQTSPAHSLDNRGISARYRSDGRFIEKVESSMKEGAMIYQLPYRQFPETPPQVKLADYDEFIPYLHSKKLRWSYGAMKGRESDEWHGCVSRLPGQKFLAEIVSAGFTGVLVHADGYEDGGRAIVGELSSLLKREPLRDERGGMFFFDASSVHASPGARGECVEAATWRDGFFPLEKGGGHDWRWSRSSGELQIKNPTGGDLLAKVRMTLATGYEKPSNMTIRGSSFLEEVKVGPQGTVFEKTLTIPRGGREVIRFHSDARRVFAPLDPRKMYFRVMDFRLETFPTGAQ